MPDGSGNAPQAHASSRLRLAFGFVACVTAVANAKAQEAEPRSYSNAPIGLNFLIAGYGYASGKIAFDPDLAIADARFAATPRSWPMSGPLKSRVSRPSST